MSGRYTRDYSAVYAKLPRVCRDRWTLKEIVEETAVYGDRPYLIDASSGKTFSYADTDRSSSRMANGLLALGLEKGDRVGVCLSNSPEYILVLFALAKAGLIEVPINPALRSPEMAHIARIAGLETVITEGDAAVAGNLLQVLEAQSSIRRVVTVGEDPLHSPVSSVRLEEISSRGGEDSPPVRVRPEDPLALFFTSGTTGMPKATPVTQAIFVLAAQSVCAIPEVNSQARNYTSLPLFHANAQLYSMTAMRCLGASLVLSRRFSPRRFWQEIAVHGATYFNSIGGMMQILDAACEEERVPEHGARFVFVGGTPASLWERFEKKFGVTVYEGYSMTEVPVLFGNFDPDPTRRPVGSFGKPLFEDLGRQVRVVDEAGHAVEAGRGELVQKGDRFVLAGYWEAPAADREAFDEGGWFHSGDVVRQDDEGFFYFLDRKKFMIRVAGENVSAFEVEAAAESFPGVERAAAVPVPDPIREEEVKVFLKLSGPAEVDPKLFLDHCSRRLAPFKLPRYVEVVAELPTTGTNRVQKTLLAAAEKERQKHGWDRNESLPDWKARFYG